MTIMIRGLVGLSAICGAAGFAGGPISTRTRPAGAARSSSRRESSCGVPLGPSLRQQTVQFMESWASIKQARGVAATSMTTGNAAGDETATEAPATPRLKRVRRRRKDGATVVTAAAKEEERKSAAGTIVEEPPRPPASPPAAVDLESVRVVAAAAASQLRAVEPQTTVAPQGVQQRLEKEEEIPVAVGSTKGTKVRVADSSDDTAADFSGVASAASGVAEGAASAVGDAAKSAIDAAMSVLGGQGGGAPATDAFDIDSMPAASERGRKRTIPGKSAAELADLGADIERFRKAESRQVETARESIASGAKDIISTIISIDFFVVIAFMLWFIAGVVSSYGFDNTFLLDQFNEKWNSVVQPALGVLMGGTIAGGVVSKLGGDDEDDLRSPRGGPRGK